MIPQASHWIQRGLVSVGRPDHMHRLVSLASQLKGAGPGLSIARSASKVSGGGSVRIGDVAVPLLEAKRPELIGSPAPSRGSPYQDTDSGLEVIRRTHSSAVAMLSRPTPASRVTRPPSAARQTLQWLMKKLLLRQDVYLLGSHPAYLRQIAFRFSELCQREVEYVSISRDTTESDLKQRREICRDPGTPAAGPSVRYVDQPVVQAALHGRILVLEGLEKAERNLLPVINNLLENREMALEDGAFLMHPDRYDALVADGLAPAELSRRRLLRVSPDFMVVALGLPVPRFPGNPLDPPLRSRFQARAVLPPPAALRKQALAHVAPAATAELGAAVDALDALEAVHALRAGGGADFALPIAPSAALHSAASLQALQPAAQPAARPPCDRRVTAV